MKIIFASNNKNKVQEIQNQVPEFIQIVTLEEIGCTEDIERSEEHTSELQSRPHLVCRLLLEKKKKKKKKINNTDKKKKKKEKKEKKKKERQKKNKKNAKIKKQRNQ